MREAIAGRFVGSSVPRVEDKRLLSGHGRFVDDIVLPGMVHGAFVRSPHAHAEIVRVDVSAARRVAGVVAIYTGAEIAEITNPYIGLLSLPGLFEPSFYSLATDRVRHVGDPVAVVVASSRRVAEDACALVEVDYRVLPAVATIGHALDPGRPALWPKSRRGNMLYESTQTYGGDIDAVFADADRVVTQRFRQHRIANQPMETRGLVVEMRADGTAVLHAPTQSAHSYKWLMALLVPRRRLRDSARRLARDRTQLKAFVRGAKGFLAANPGLAEANKQSSPEMLKGMARDPRQALALQRSLVGLLSKNADERPEVRAPDIGGAFGSKGSLSREDVAVYAVARHLGRTVKFVEDRTENLMGGGHAREEQVDIGFALRHDGTLLGIRAALTVDAGAYPGVPFSAALMSAIIKVMLPGPYRVPALRFDSKAIASNKGSYVPYRGPWAVETWVRERMWDICAHELGLGRDEIRLKNIVDPSELPTAMVTGPMLDVRMSAKRTLTDALAIAELHTWPERQAAARAEGRLVGIGFATFIEAAPGPPGFADHVMPGFGAVMGREPAHVTLDDDGSITVYSQQVPHGQSHETTFAQVAADELGVPIESVRFVWGDTTKTPFGLLGTGGSRAAAMTGGAVTHAARELRGRILDVAASVLEADRADLTITDGNVHVAGVPARGIGLDAVAADARRRSPDPLARSGESMRVHGEFDGGEGGWSQATHVCWVEIDPDTGVVTIPRYVVVEDCGELINPAIVEGQVRGGVAQGIGQVLYERLSYDHDGNMTASTFMDYLIPTCMEIPPIEIHHVETPSDVEANYRGVGEGGMIAAPAALTNAIEDALRHLGVRITESFLPPSRILELMGVIGPAS
jgi:aerobic carbon-monoxide dehydrogenase large subunit